MAYYILKSYKLKVTADKIFTALSRNSHCFFLDSCLNFSGMGRYSFLGVDPFLTLKIKAKDPFSILREHLEKYKISAPKNSPPFLGGAVGYLTYDLGLILEKKIRTRPKQELGLPDAAFGFYNTVVIIDHLASRIYICASGFPERKSSLENSLAETNLKKIYNLICESISKEAENNHNPFSFGHKTIESNFSKEGYIRAIKKAKEYIRCGDIYQVNLSQRFHAETNLSGIQIYQRLRSLSKACFNAYFNAGEAEILSSSPERFLSLRNNRVVTRPMKGTRPRSKNKKQDVFLKKELLDSPKDKAELMMVTDLERNDLGKVCNYDSVKVTKLRELEAYKTVYQATSTIEGKLYKDKDRIDLLRACFPGGSITGCPKIRAMEIIEELEPDRRSIYTGVLGYLSFSGDMDFNILIRTILKKDNDLYFGVGGGIVTDSDPQEEYQETLVKAKAIFKALGTR